MIDKSRSLDDQFLYDHYCKKCGDHQSFHDDIHCKNSRYPALEVEHGHLFVIADLYKIDLTDANFKQADNGRHGAIEGDLMLDICGAVHQHYAENPKEISLIRFVEDELDNWGYSTEDIIKAVSILGGLKN